MIARHITHRHPVALLAILLLVAFVRDGFGRGLNQPPRPPVGLAWKVQPKGPRMEIEFTNHRGRQLAIILGNRECQVEPGKSKKLQFQNQQPLQAAERVLNAARGESGSSYNTPG